MIKIFKYLFLSLFVLLAFSCQTVSKKIDEKTALEEKELSKWLNQPESELKIFFGKPDKINFKIIHEIDFMFIYLKNLK